MWLGLKLCHHLAGGHLHLQCYSYIRMHNHFNIPISEYVSMKQNDSLKLMGISRLLLVITMILYVAY